MRRSTWHAKKPELSIKDPYELNETQYAEVLKLLRGQHPLIQRYWHDANVQVQDFQNEGIVASGSWPFQANTLLANKAPIATTVPAEGATGWADTTMLAAGAKHPNCAYKWLEWSISPKVQGDVAAWFGSNPVVPKACEGNELLGAEGCKNNGFENFDKIKFWRTPEAKCASHVEGCVPYNRWVTDYVAVIGGQVDALAAMTAAIEFRGVSRIYGEVRAVDDVSFAVEPGEFFAMLGPSGSGKTTCLRLVAGFDTPNSGQVLLDGADVSAMPPYERNVNTVFQDYALFPHMTVLENVAYGPRVRGVAKAEREQRARAKCSSWCSWARRASAGRRSCPAASASGSRWRAR